MINLYLCQSPLQVLSANEAREKLGKDTKNILFLALVKLDVPSHQKHLQKAIEFGEWDDVIHIGPNFSDKQLLNFSDSLKIYLYRLKKINTVFIGNFKSRWMHEAIEILNVNDAYLLDDGIITVANQEEFLSRGTFNFLKVQGVKPRVKFSRPAKTLRDLTRRLMGYTGNRQYTINLFTSFAIETTGQQTIIHNNYDYIRSKLTIKNTQKSQVYYFGTKYSEAGYFDLETEIAFLSKVFQYYSNKGKSIIYIAHRDDSDHKLREIQSRFGIKTKRLHSPAEIYFLSEGWIPQAIAGAFSTALINLQHIYGIDDTVFFQLPIQHIAPNKKQSVIAIYDFYRSIGMNVVDLYQPRLK